MRLRRRGRRAEWKGIRRCNTISSSREEVVPVVHLPMDIIEDEILWRLPVKSLLRCKSVCKLWYSIIKNPKFIKSHYHNQQNNSNTTRRLFFERFRYRKRLPVVFNPSFKTDYSIWPIPMMVDQNQNQNRGGKIDVNNVNALSFFSYYLGLPSLGMFVRPVNGLSLIVLPDYVMYRCRMAVFNPTTKQFRKLPLDDFEVNTLSDHERYPINIHHIFGFGICSTTPVCKVVWLNQLPPQFDVVIAKVYTVVIGLGGGGDQDWRIVNAALPRGFVGNYSNDPSYGLSMNGKCYWLSKDLAHILVFDLDEEVFQEMSSPVPSKYLARYASAMRRLNIACSEVRCPGKEHNSLALFVFETNFVHISVMDKEEEWHWIQYEVSYIDRPIGDLFNLNPLQLQELLQSPITEAILLKAGQNSFALYNLKTNCCVRFEDPSDDSDEDDTYSKVSVFNFKESLFSIDGAVQVSDSVLEDFYTF